MTNPTALLVAIATILAAIVFALIASKSPSGGSSFPDRSRTKNESSQKKGFFERFRQGNNDRLWRELLKRVDRDTAQRLVDGEKRRNPGQPENWYLDKVIYDLKRGR